MNLAKAPHLPFRRGWWRSFALGLALLALSVSAAAHAQCCVGAMTGAERHGFLCLDGVGEDGAERAGRIAAFEAWADETQLPFEVPGKPGGDTESGCQCPIGACGMAVAMPQHAGAVLQPMALVLSDFAPTQIGALLERAQEKSAAPRGPPLFLL